MKYLVMVQSSQADLEAGNGKGSATSPAWSEDDLQAMFKFMHELNNDLSESGEFVDAQGLTAPAQARFVDVDKDGRPVITDGPYGRPRKCWPATGCWTARASSGSPRSRSGSSSARCPRARPPIP